MKKWFVLFGLLALVFWAVYHMEAHAQEPVVEPPPAVNLGEENLLLVVCSELKTRIESDGIGFIWCRQNGQPEVNGNSASVRVVVKIEGGNKFAITVRLMRTPWNVQGFTSVEPL